MNVTCNGCGKAVPFNETTVHDQQCEHHDVRTDTGWGKCTNEGRCYRPAGEGIAA